MTGSMSVAEAATPPDVSGIESRTFTWPHQGRPTTVGLDEIGRGPPALLLPALSSISTREEMHPLAARLAVNWRCRIPDWPGFGNVPRARVALTPQSLRHFLHALVTREIPEQALGVAAGHAAPYLVEVARETGRFAWLVLVAPTWRGPLPTAMGEARRPLYARIRRLIEWPLLGALLYRVNVSRPIVLRMLRGHVYAEPQSVVGERLRRKLAVTRRRGARFGTAAFVTGGLDPVSSHAEFLALFQGPLPPTLVIRPESAPRRSAAEMDVLTAERPVARAEVPGALAAHEEAAGAVAEAIERFVAAGPRAD